MCTTQRQSREGVKPINGLLWECVCVWRGGVYCLITMYQHLTLTVLFESCIFMKNKYTDQEIDAGIELLPYIAKIKGYWALRLNDHAAE